MLVDFGADDRRGAERLPERHVRLPGGRARGLGPPRPAPPGAGRGLRRARVPEHARRRRRVQREDGRRRASRSASPTGPARSPGPSFENDPNNLIAWNLQAGAGARVLRRPARRRARPDRLDDDEQANVTGYQIRQGGQRRPGPSRSSRRPEHGASGYGFVDSPLAANQTGLLRRLRRDERRRRAPHRSGSATPYSSATPGNVKKVGGNGAFATIQAAINAATDPNSVVWVTPGTYASFTIGATAVPSNLRILGDDDDRTGRSSRPRTVRSRS